MKITFGNAHAKEGYRDPTSDDPEMVRYRDLEGERITEIILPDRMALTEAIVTLTNPEKGVIQFHVQKGHAPSWFEGDNEVLVTFLKDHYGVTKNRPKTWGKKGSSS